MLRKIFSSSEKYAGLSVSASQVVFSFVVKKFEQFTVIEQGKFDIADISYTLKKLKEIVGNSPCYLALPHHHFMLKTLQFSDSFKEDEFIELLRLNSEYYFSKSAADIVFDLEFICRARNKIRVLAGKKDYVANWTKLFTKAGLNLKLMTVDLLAAEQYLVHYQLIENEKTYGVFIVTENELLQIVIADSRVCFSNKSFVNHENPYFFQQEITKFFRIYESSKVFLHPITHVIFLGFENKIVEILRQEIPLPIVNNANHQQKLNNSDYLFSMGMMFEC